MVLEEKKKKKKKKKRPWELVELQITLSVPLSVLILKLCKQKDIGDISWNLVLLYGISLEDKTDR